jgi:dsDNA-specific endonuclease/ATPase MutS2
MEDKDLRDLLTQLHDEINNTQKVDKKGSELLNDIDMHIRDLLERSGKTPVQLHPTAVQNMQSALVHFEVTHPSLTTLISKLLDTFSNAGI